MKQDSTALTSALEKVNQSLNCVRWISACHITEIEQKCRSSLVLHHAVHVNWEENSIEKIAPADKFVKSLALPLAFTLQSPNTTDT